MRCIALAILVATTLATPAPAQQGGVALGGLATDTTAPVEVTADALSLDQETGTATFSGNVVVTQGELRMAAPSIEVVYNRAGDGSIGEGLERITASGGVVLVTPTEAAEAETAVFTPGSNEVVMSGAVVLTQGQNTLAGERLVVNLTTGTGRIEGRVRTVLQGGAPQ